MKKSRGATKLIIGLMTTACLGTGIWFINQNTNVLNLDRKETVYATEGGEVVISTVPEILDMEAGETLKKYFVPVDVDTEDEYPLTAANNGNTYARAYNIKNMKISPVVDKIYFKWTQGESGTIIADGTLSLSDVTIEEEETISVHNEATGEDEETLVSRTISIDYQKLDEFDGVYANLDGVETLEIILKDTHSNTESDPYRVNQIYLDNHIDDPGYIEHVGTKTLSVNTTGDTDEGHTYYDKSISLGSGNIYTFKEPVYIKNLVNGKDYDSGFDKTKYEISDGRIIVLLADILTFFADHESPAVLFGIEEGELLSEKLIAEGTEDIVISKDGIYVAQARTYDKLGNDKTNDGLIFILDRNQNATTSPVIEFTGDDNNPVQSVKVKAYDVSKLKTRFYYKWVTKAEFENAGKDCSAFDSQITNTKNFNSSGEATISTKDCGLEGKCYLLVKVVDSLGNVGYGYELFTIDGKVTEASTAMIKKLSNDQVVDDDIEYVNYDVYVEIKEGRDGTGASARSIDTRYSIEKDGVTFIDDVSSAVRTNLTEEGTYNVNVISTDSGGNTTSASRVITIDKTAPVITATTTSNPADDQCTKAGAITETGSPIITERTKYIWTQGYKIGNTDAETAAWIESEGTLLELNERREFTVTSPSGYDGAWKLFVVTYDEAGNIGLYQDTAGGSDRSAPYAGELLVEYTTDGTSYTAINFPTSKITENHVEDTSTPGKIFYSSMETTYEAGDYPDKDVKKIKLTLTKGYDYESGIRDEKVYIRKDNGAEEMAGTLTVDSLEVDCEDNKEIEYSFKVKTTNNKGLVSTRIYIVRVDKKGPNIEAWVSDSSVLTANRAATSRIARGFVTDGMSGVSESDIESYWINYYSKEKIDDGDINLRSCEKPIEQGVIPGVDGAPDTPDGKWRFAARTPDKYTGYITMVIEAEDAVGNKTTYECPQEIFLDNKKPGKPDIDLSVKAMQGTQQVDAPLSGNTTRENVKITTYAYDYISGVDIYQYSYYDAENNTWSDWITLDAEEYDCPSDYPEQIKNNWNSFKDLHEVKEGTITVNEILEEMGKSEEEIRNFEGQVIIKTRAIKQEREDFYLKDNWWKVYSGSNSAAKGNIVVGMTYNPSRDTTDYPERYVQDEANKDGKYGQAENKKFYIYSESDEIAINIDRKAPIIELMNTSINRSDKLGGTADTWVKSEIIKVSAQDPSGINENRLSYKWIKVGETEGDTWIQVNGSIVSTPELPGKYVLKVKAEDNAYGTDGHGNIAEVTSKQYWVDVNEIATPKVAATIQEEVEGEAETVIVDLATRNNMTNKNVTLEVDTNDVELPVSGITYYYSFDNETWLELGKQSEINATSKKLYAYTHMITEEGIYKVYVKAVNGVGTESSEAILNFMIDKTAPEIKVSHNGTENAVRSMDVTITATDAKSGLSSSNIYKYALSTDDTSVDEHAEAEGRIGTFENGVPFEIGKVKVTEDGRTVTKSLTGLYYLHVYLYEVVPGTEGGEDTVNYLIKDNVGNGHDISETIAVKKPFIFNNEEDKPTVTFTNVINQEENPELNIYNGTISEGGTPVWVRGITVNVKVRDEMPADIDEDDEEAIARRPSGVNTDSIRYKWVEHDADEPDITKGWDAPEDEDDFLNHVPSEMAADYKVASPTRVTGIYRLYVYAEDNFGNVEIAHSKEYYIDDTAPEGYITTKLNVIEVEGNTETIGAELTTEKTNKSVALGMYGASAPSGISYEYSIDDGATWEPAFMSRKTITEDGETIEVPYGEAKFYNSDTYFVKVRAVGGTGLATYGYANTFTIDKIAPYLTYYLSTYELTNRNVRVTISADEEIQDVEGWNRVAQSNSSIYKDFENNIEETEIKVKDEVGNEGSIKIKIENIDKTFNDPQVIYSTVDKTNGHVIVTILADEKIRPVESWRLSDTNKALVKEYANNTSESGENITVTDWAGNTKTVNVKILNIDRDNPLITVTYETKENGVEVTISSNKELQPIEGWTISEDRKSMKKFYTQDTNEVLKPKDLAGNEGIAIVDVKITREYIRPSKYEFETDILDGETEDGIKENYLRIYGQNITVTKLLRNLNLVSTNYKVYKVENNTKTELTTDEQRSSTKVTTGNIIIEFPGVRYIAVIMGDANCDGDVTFEDIALVNQFRFSTLTASTIEEIASNVIETDEASITFDDIAEINKYRFNIY